VEEDHGHQNFEVARTEQYSETSIPQEAAEGDLRQITAEDSIIVESYT
jgi:hypothetical protein